MDFDILVQRVRQLEEYLKIGPGQAGQTGPRETRVTTSANGQDRLGKSGLEVSVLICLSIVPSHRREYQRL